MKKKTTKKAAVKKPVAKKEVKVTKKAAKPVVEKVALADNEKFVNINGTRCIEVTLLTETYIKPLA